MPPRRKPSKEEQTHMKKVASKRKLSATATPKSKSTKRSRKEDAKVSSVKKERQTKRKTKERTRKNQTTKTRKVKNKTHGKIKPEPQEATLKSENEEIKTEIPVTKPPLASNMPKTKAVSGKLTKFVGAHVSISGGLENAVSNAVAIGAKAFALFLRSQRQWVSKPLADETAEKFRTACKEHGFSPHLILPHGSYLLNCGSPNQETLQKSRDGLVDELQRCEKLGLTMFNFHPGSTCGEITIDECLDKIGDSINQAHDKTKSVIAVIENMSCQGNTIGGKFSELRGIIDRVKDKSRVGVCLDTCHAFAAGFDVKSEKGFQKMMSEFEDTVGMEYLKAVHLNDSKGECGCHLDRHENIGRGKIGLKGFKYLMNDPRFDNIPLILETPMNMSDEEEIKILYSLCK